MEALARSCVPSASLQKQQFAGLRPVVPASHVRMPVSAMASRIGSALSIRAAVATAGDSPAAVAKEMERVAAKEALLLAIKDAGGANALATGSGNSSAKIEVSEKLVALERLNPTPRPTTSPLFEGLWDVVWSGTRSPGITAAKIVLGRFPPQLATLESLKLDISSSGTTATAGLKILSTIESSVTVNTSLAVEGPFRFKEEYIEAVVSTPVVPNSSIPDAVKGVLSQLTSAAESLPAAVKDTLASGLKLPLNNVYNRELIISYLDDELLVARDQSGLADVLVREISATAVEIDSDMEVDYES